MKKSIRDSRGCLSFLNKALSNLINIGDSISMVPVCSRMTGAMLFCILTSALLACSTRNEPVRTRDTLLPEYHSFSDSLESLSSIPFCQLPAIVDRWFTLEDELYSYILADSLHKDENIIAFSTVSVLGNRIEKKVRSTIDLSLHDFTDVAVFEYELSSRRCHPENRFVCEADEFYDINSCHSAVFDSIGSELSLYMSFLDEINSYEICDFDIVKDILYQEDLLYRAYMDNMMAHSSCESSAIVRQTEILSDRLSDYVECHPDESDRLLAYMTVRTIRRQLICARRGLDCIFSGEVRTLEQATDAATCFTALLVNFNPLLISCRNEEQNQEVMDICHRIPKAFQVLQDRGLNIISSPDSLPNRILNDYIDYLMYN